MKRIPRRIFREEFKREAIKLVNEQGLTIAEASKKLDIASKSLRTWMKQEQAGLNSFDVDCTSSIGNVSSG